MASDESIERLAQWFAERLTDPSLLCNQLKRPAKRVCVHCGNTYCSPVSVLCDSGYCSDACLQALKQLLNGRLAD